MKKIIMAIPSVLAAGFAALPVLTCPACWPLYAGLLSAVGIGFVDYTPYLLPVTAVLLIISLFPLVWKAKQRRGYLPFILGFLASVFIFMGKFQLDLAWMFYGGMVLLLTASIWNLWPKSAECKACVSEQQHRDRL